MDANDAQQGLEARVYHLERELERLEADVARHRGAINAAIVRIALIEAKAAMWGTAVGGLVAALMSWLLHR